MNTAKKPKPQKKTVEIIPPEKNKTSKKPEIPTRLLEDFVGHVPNLFMIKAIHLWENRFRVNVWTQEYQEDRVCPDYNIVKSYFVFYNGKRIIDRSIPAKPQKKRIF
ncbi:uncharacterized protein METZ01_LOCUS130343 [marine metagenome]|uniref:Uncharacterized protein n=1 Tax=marine metagenome TaxID=408172 RepID=A0A381YKH5_9ZZZZ|tara:strand:- start:461 stop:781 length:321 start_codon:yes stop_codon:yes gene_type:complete